MQVDLDMAEMLIRKAPTAGHAAAMWWSNVLKDPKFDNGGTGRAGALTQLLAGMAASRNLDDPDAYEAFAKYLAEAVDKKLDEAAPGSYDEKYGVGLDVDYHPDQLLSECAERAHLDIMFGGWPCKTHMTVTKTRVKVSYGYRAEYRTIWGEGCN